MILLFQRFDFLQSIFHPKLLHFLDYEELEEGFGKFDY